MSLRLGSDCRPSCLCRRDGEDCLGRQRLGRRSRQPDHKSRYSAPHRALMQRPGARRDGSPFTCRTTGWTNVPPCRSFSLRGRADCPNSGAPQAAGRGNSPMNEVLQTRAAPTPRVRVWPCGSFNAYPTTRNRTRRNTEEWRRGRQDNRGCCCASRELLLSGQTGGQTIARSRP